MKTYIVDTSDLQKNIRNLVARADGTPIFAVLKGNGYGLGFLPMARACREGGITRFALTEVCDVRTLRENGFETEDILMLRATGDCDELRQLLALNATVTLSSQDDAAVLGGIAAQLGVQAKAHLKIDVGMGRYGFLPTELDKILPLYAYMDAIAITGIYAHFSVAFCDKKTTHQQAAAFRSVVEAVRQAGYDPGMAHICNSAGFLRFPEYKMDAVRIGSALLGRLSFGGSYSLKRIGRCEAAIEELRWLPKGATCGYGAAWRAKKPTRIAVVPVGWYHGFACEMGNDIFRFRDGLRVMVRGLKILLGRGRLTVAIHGKNCPTLGHVGMLHTVCDVTNVDCRLGDKAILNVNPIMLKGIDVEFQ